MATPDQIKALLAVTCSWCGAQPGQKCMVRYGKRTTVPSTLDGECHDARWQAALGIGARVITAVIEERKVRSDQEPEPVAASIAVLDRPRMERPF